MVLPLGLGAAHTDAEITAAAVYSLLYSSIFMGPFDPPLDAEVALRDRSERHLRLSVGESVHVGIGAGGGPGFPCRLEASTLAFIDALAGRGSLAEAITVTGDSRLRDRLEAAPTRLRPAGPDGG